jgi:cell pole-organizing protein PopZ
MAPSTGGLVSERTESIAASTFGTLTSNLLVPHSDRTLEDVAKELLRPLLQSWLDQHLPGIVEEQVRLEVERIARQSRR